MKEQQTPVPWKGDLNTAEDRFGIFADTGKMEFAIAWLPEINRPEVNAANADFIVRAVNSHADLIEALDELLTETELPYATQLRDRQEAARAALSRARGEGS